MPGLKVNWDDFVRRVCQLRGKNGGTRQNIASKVCHMEFLKSELVDIREVKNKLEQLKTEKENLEKENVRLHERCDQLYKELLEVEAVGKKAEEELKMTFVDQERLKKENAHLHQYLDKTEEQKQFATTGKRISEVKERQLWKNHYGLLKPLVSISVQLLSQMIRGKAIMLITLQETLLNHLMNYLRTNKKR